MGELEVTHKSSRHGIPTEDGYGSARSPPSLQVLFLRMQTPWEAISVCLQGSVPGSNDRAASVWEATGRGGGPEAKTSECKFRVSHTTFCWDEGCSVLHLEPCLTCAGRSYWPGGAHLNWWGMSFQALQQHLYYLILLGVHSSH